MAADGGVAALPQPAAVPLRLGARCARAAGLAATVALAATCGLVLSLALAVSVPQIFGYTTLTVLSGSMEPTLETGGVVVAKRVSPLDARVGDIVVFHDPTRDDILVTHRLQRISIRDGRADMVTRGDANDTSERWAVPTAGEIGRVAYHVPKIGFVREQLNGRSLRLGLIGLVVLLGALVLIDIWRPSRARAA